MCNSALPVQFITLLIQGNPRMVALAVCSDSLKATDGDEVDGTYGEQLHSSSEIQCLSTWLKSPLTSSATNAFRDEDYRTKYTISRTWLNQGNLGLFGQTRLSSRRLMHVR